MNVLDFIVCDEIRMELGNKASLMGVFGDEMAVSVTEPSHPFVVRLGVLLRVSLKHDSAVPDNMHFLIRRGESVVFDTNTPMTVNDPSRPITAALNIQQCIVPNVGELTFEFLFKRGSVQVADAIVRKIGVVAASQEQRTTA